MGRVTERNRFIGEMARQGKGFGEANRLWKERSGSVEHRRNPEGIGSEAVAVGLGIVGASLFVGLLASVGQKYLMGAQYGSVDWSKQMKGTGGLW